MLTVGPALAGVIRRPRARPADVLPRRRGQLRASLYGVARLPALPSQAGPARPGCARSPKGSRFVRRSQVLTGAFLADLNATVFGLPVALFPAINAERVSAATRALSACSPPRSGSAAW